MAETWKTYHWVVITDIVKDNFEEMVWDAALKEAHNKGIIPVGPINVRKAEDSESWEQFKALDDGNVRMGVMLGGVKLYVAEGMVGASLETE